MSTSNGRPYERPHHVVVVGGGFGGLQAVRQLRTLPVSITLIDRRSFDLFQPLVYQVATGTLAGGEIAVPLRAVFKRDPNVGRAKAVADFRWLRLSGLPAWLAWLLVHLFFLIGMQNRLLVLTRWMFSYLTRGGGARLITGSEVSPAARAVVHS